MVDVCLKNGRRHNRQSDRFAELAEMIRPVVRLNRAR